MKVRPTAVSSFPALTACVLSLLMAACGGNDTAGQAASAEPGDAQVTAAEVATAASAAASENVSTQVAMRMNAAAVADGSTTDRFIVRYKAGTREGKDAAAVQSRLSGFRSAFPAGARHQRRMGTGSDIIRTERKLNARDAKAFMRAIASDSNVEYVEPDVEMSVQMVPNDPDYYQQWGLVSNQPPENAPYQGIRAQGAWDISSGAGSIIAIVDSGLTPHSEYNSRLLVGRDLNDDIRSGNGMNPGTPGSTCSLRWHGTHVAGIAAASTNNGIGIAGVAPSAKLLPVRSLNPCGNGIMSDVADGIIWAAGGTVPNVPVNPNRAKVINLSVGGNGQCPVTMQNAIDYATSQGAIVVVAAGNNRVDVSNAQPANCHNVITVGGTDTVGTWTSSNFGPGIDIAAPAAGIWSTMDSGTTVPAGETYGFKSGTSMATPMVSGVVALAQAVAPKALTVAEYRTLLQQNAQPFVPPASRLLGAGVLDATKTVAAAKAGVVPVAADFTCKQEPTPYMAIDCEDLSTARSGVPIKTRHWDWGSAPVSTSLQNEIRVRYKHGGIQSITLTVTDENGQTSKVSRPIRVDPPPTVNLDSDKPVPFSGRYGDVTFFETRVPDGAKSLTFSLNIPNPNETTSIWVNDAPSDVRAICVDIKPGPNTVSCTVNNPRAGLWYAKYFISSNFLSGATAMVSVK